MRTTAADAVPTIGHLLTDQAAINGTDLAVITPTEEVTFAELAEAATAVARSLRSFGIGPGTRVAVVLPNSPRHAAIIFGTALAGATIVPLNARFRSADLGHVLRHSSLSIVFTCGAVDGHPDYLERVLGAGADELSLPVVVIDERAPVGVRPWSWFVHAGRDDNIPSAGEQSVDPGDHPALLLYTSGTTALPKGCIIGHEALIVNWSNWASMLQLDVGDRVWAPGPYFHISGIGPLVGCAASGAAVLTAGHSDGEETVRMIWRHRAAHLFPGFPALALSVLNSPAYDRERFDFLRTLHNVAPTETQMTIQSLLPQQARVTSNFGMTEGVGAITYTHPTASVHTRLETVGTPLPGFEIRVVHPESDLPVDVGTRGEIQFRGPTTFSGYWRDPDSTAATLIDGGWVKTGDLGEIDEAGNLRYTGRIKDMLKVGGENIAPLELENLLTQHPGVHLAQVVGQPDERLGEVPFAFIEASPGATPTPAELTAFMAERVASFKVPRAFALITQWPMNATKIQKTTLRTWVRDGQTGPHGADD